MNTVVLMGFSTSGKSTILKYFKDHYRKKIQTLDTDKQIAKDHGGHIYNVFFDKVKGNNDRKESLDFIEQREREILTSLSSTANTARLIAAGPCLPCREKQRVTFVEKVRPVCIHLELTADEVYKGLIDRRNRHIDKGLNRHPYFGCWDYDVTTTYKNGKYVLLPKNIAINNINRHMKKPVEIYNKCCQERKYRARQLKKYSKLRDEFFNQIIKYLDI